MNSTIKKYIASEYPRVKDIYSIEDNKLNNHVLRVCMQSGDISNMERHIHKIINEQHQDGGWGIRADSCSLIGITGTILQLLLWRKEQLDGAAECKLYNRQIMHGIEFLLAQRTSDPFFCDHEVDENGFSTHGLIDVNHYIMQIMFYVIRDVDFAEYWDACREVYESLAQFYLCMQSHDGGWHEVDRVRFRVGVTADAIRALLPNKEFLHSITRGIEFLCNNVSPYHGYWEKGDIDSNLDALKALINAYWMCNTVTRNKMSMVIKNGVNFIVNNYKIYELSEEATCDLLTVFCDYVLLEQHPDKEKKFF